MNLLQVEPPAMALALAASFGSVARWHEDWARVAQGGTPADQVVLAFVPTAGRLVHALVQPGEAPAPGAMEVWRTETNSAPAVDWAAAYERYQHAVHSASDAFAAATTNLGDALVLDVRRDAPFQQAKTMLPGATWRDPAQVGTWAAELPRGKEVVVYCIYGHEVGRSTAMRLRAEGVQARVLPGGIDAWERAGHTVVPRTPGQ
jgi:Fe-Mn family superoxide dismutase